MPSHGATRHVVHASAGLTSPPSPKPTPPLTPDQHPSPPPSCCSGGSSDPLGLQSATAPALAVLDKMYATQAVLDRLWEEHGDDVEGWPDEVVASLARRSRQITLQVGDVALGRGGRWVGLKAGCGPWVPKYEMAGEVVDLQPRT